MPVEVDDVATLQVYLRGVLASAKDHANNIEIIVLGLAGAIIARKDAKTPLEVHSGKGGALGRALTVTIENVRYAFSYNHDDYCIDMKVGSFQGEVIHKFTNETPLMEIAHIFETLWAQARAIP